jgi:nitroreductase
MDAMHAIFHRRAVRDYLPKAVPKEMVMELIRAAIQAPSAANLQPWVFIVIRGRRRLEVFSDRAKEYLLATLPQTLELHQQCDNLANPQSNVFHHAGTLIVICARPARFNYVPSEDCCLAGQNLMLAAHAMGLGTCPVGFVRPWLNLPEIKEELRMPYHCSVVLPIVVGWPVDPESRAMPRIEAEIVWWRDDQEDGPRGFGDDSRPPMPVKEPVNLNSD